MEKLSQGRFTGERALFGSKDLMICDSVFEDGESPLKESSNISVHNCLFRWKYPFWYCDHVDITDCSIFDMGRAGIWYSNHVSMKNTIVEAPKNFRRCKGVSLTNVDFPNAAETFWNCEDVEMDHVVAKGDYLSMGCKNMKLWDFRLIGNYSFDGCENLEIHNSKLLSKDAFWNTDNVTVYDSFISGEYLGWNAKNLTLINCTIESLQGMCYIDNLVMKNCKLINTTLAFEYSTVDAEISSNITSVLNPTSGTIIADHIDTLILEKDRVDVTRTRLVVQDESGMKQLDRFEG